MPYARLCTPLSWWLLLCAATVGGIAVPCAIARAEPRTFAKVALDVEHDPTGCLMEPDLRRRVDRYLAHRSVDRALALSVTTRVHSPSFTVRKAGRLIAVRRFEFPRASCGDRREALALAIALALEGEGRKPAHAKRELGSKPKASLNASARRRQRITDRSIPSSAALALEAPIAEVEAISPLPEAGVRVGAFAGGVLVAAALPDAISGVATGLELRLGERLTLQFGALAAPEHELALGLGHLRLSLVAGRLLGCANWSVPGVRIAGCVGGIGGMVFAAGSGFAAENRHASTPWIAGLLGVSADVPARGTVALRASIGGMINATRPTLWVKTAHEMLADRSGLFGIETALSLVIQLS